MPAFASLNRDDQFRMLQSILAERFHLKVIYVGKAIPTGGRKGEVEFDATLGHSLFNWM